MNGLPPVETPVLVAAVDGLPARLKKKLDDSAAKFGGLSAVQDGERYTVTIDEATVVTLTTAGGVVRSAEAVTCTCLLAPNCLHRAGILTLAPIADGAAGGVEEAGAEESATDQPATDQSAADKPGADKPGADKPGADKPGVEQAGVGPAGAGGEPAVPVDGVEVLSGVQAAAVAQLWRAAVGVLGGGVSGTGAVARTALLRAAHEAQAHKVYRAAAGARVVATMLQQARSGDRNYRLADLTEALRDLLTVLHRLRVGGGSAGGVEAGVVGTARRQYQLQGSLRLHGLCTTAVLAGTGHAGVVTYVADRRGRVWAIADLMPGDARRAAAGGNATIKMGETALTHRGLTRAGLVVTGATAAANRQLGAGKGVRAVTASGCAWHEEPLAGLWAQPVAEQVHRAFAALGEPVGDRTAGADLLFLRLTLHGFGPGGDAIAAAAADGSVLWLRPASDEPALGYRENHRVLGRAEGLEVLLIGRPDPGRPGTVLPLAIAPPPEGPDWNLPAQLAGHADLAFDRLHRSQLPMPDNSDISEVPATGAPATGAPAAGPPAAGSPAAGAPAAGTPAAGTPAAGAPAAGTPAAGTPAAGAPAVEGTTEAEAEAEPGEWRPILYDPALQLLRSHVERTVSGGRAIVALPNGRGKADAGRLRRASLETGAQLLDRLHAAAADRPRDAFGRLGDDDGSAFGRSWLAAAVYLDMAGRAYAEAAWLPSES